MHGFLSENCKISQLSTVTAGAAATSAITSSALNMAGFDGVMFIVSLGTIVTGAVTSIKIQQSSDDGSSDDYSDVSGTGQTIADTADDTTIFSDVIRPGKQYLKLLVSRGTQNATVGSIIAIQYAKRSKSQSGMTHGGSVSGEQAFTPAEGTA